jgi:hypothetical protein
MIGRVIERAGRLATINPAFSVAGKVGRKMALIAGCYK